MSKSTKTEKTRGFTIVETMIFLAVSAGLFALTVAVFSGQNRRAQFNQAVKDVELRIQDIFNDVETGYYPSSEDFGCRIGVGGEPELTAGANEKGTNAPCVFFGRVMQLAPSGSPGSIDIYTVYGARDIDNNANAVQRQITSNPRISTDNRLIDTITIQAGLEVINATQSGIAIITDFENSSGGASSGILSSSIKQVDNTPLNLSSSVFVTRTNTPGSYQNPPADGASFCLSDGTNGRRALVTLGVDNQRLSVSSQVDSTEGVCS